MIDIKSLNTDLPVKSCGTKYVGNTTDHFRSRWNNFKSNVRKA